MSQNIQELIDYVEADYSEISERSPRYAKKVRLMIDKFKSDLEIYKKNADSFNNTQQINNEISEAIRKYDYADTVLITNIVPLLEKIKKIIDYKKNGLTKS